VAQVATHSEGARRVRNRLGCVGHADRFGAFAFIADPAFSNDANPWWLLLDSPLAIFQIALSVLLLVKPLRLPAVASHAQAQA
jgi:hypothetical protein